MYYIYYFITLVLSEIIDNRINLTWVIIEWIIENI